MGQLRFPWWEEPGEGWTLVHTRFITLKNGRKLDCQHYGRRCWTFWVRTDRRRSK